MQEFIGILQAISGMWLSWGLMSIFSITIWIIGNQGRVKKFLRECETGPVSNWRFQEILLSGKAKTEVLIEAIMIVMYSTTLILFMFSIAWRIIS